MREVKVGSLQRCLCRHTFKKHGAYKQCIIQNCYCPYFTKVFRDERDKILWEGVLRNRDEKARYREETYKLNGEVRALHQENERLQRWLVESNAEKAKWESCARGTVGLVLAYMRLHGHWDKAASCELCRQAEKVLQSLGFKLQTGPPEDNDPKPWKS